MFDKFCDRPVHYRYVHTLSQSTRFLQATELENELNRVVRGEVRFDRGSRALYATDGSNYRQIPIWLVIPRDSEDVAWLATADPCRVSMVTGKHVVPYFQKCSGPSWSILSGNSNQPGIQITT